MGEGGSYTSSQDGSSQLSNQIKILAVLSEAMGERVTSRGFNRQPIATSSNKVPEKFGFGVPAHFRDGST